MNVCQDKARDRGCQQAERQGVRPRSAIHGRAGRALHSEFESSSVAWFKRVVSWVTSLARRPGDLSGRSRSKCVRKARSSLSFRMRLKRYPSDPTRTQGKRLKRLLPPAKPGGRPREVKLREVLNGLLYIARGGCAWRMMPTDLPPWSTCYDSFRKSRNDGTWQRINNALRTQIRHRDQREKSPSMDIIDTQSVKTTQKGGPRARTRIRGSTAGSGTWWSTRWGWWGRGPFRGHPGPGRGQVGPEEDGGPVPPAEEDPGR